MARNNPSNTIIKPQYRYGIGEWYGQLFTGLTIAERQHLARIQFLSKEDRPEQPCPFRSTGERVEPCTKAGGVCSIRLYQATDGTVSVAPDNLGMLRATCPNRFYEGMEIIRWVGEDLLQHPHALLVKEVKFLQKTPDPDGSDDHKRDDVGRIDMILVHPDAEPLSWCAMELQAVYFSGTSMNKDFKQIASYQHEGIPFPAGKRRPDYRSSGPKRLMPQLQIKVPTLRRWGKKMAVVVDRGFFDSLGAMDTVNDVSNCDIVWVVVRFAEKTPNSAGIALDFIRYTTLERAVEGLTGGVPVAQSTFEQGIRRKLHSVDGRSE